MSGKIADARARLYAALVPLLPDGRVHRHVPSTVATPCIWIGHPRVTTRVQGRGSTFIVCTLTVTIAVDGADVVQQQALDELTAIVWDACEQISGAQPISAVPRVLDIGGPNTTGEDIDVEIATASRTLCPPPIITTTEGINAHG